MQTDRDPPKPLLASAVEFFGAGTIAVLLNVPEAEVRRWADGLARPPRACLRQIEELMEPPASEEITPAKAGGPFL